MMTDRPGRMGDRSRQNPNFRTCCNPLQTSGRMSWFTPTKKN
jgi:hypothetical protein